MGRPESPNKREFISLKMLPELIQALERLAEEEGRTRSNVLERAVHGWFRDHRPDLLTTSPETPT